MSLRQYNKTEFFDLIKDWYEFNSVEDIMDQVEVWLQRGKKVAIYRNHDMSSSACGLPQIMTFGDSSCYFEVESVDDLPKQMPDTPTQINWRYCLEGWMAA